MQPSFYLRSSHSSHSNYSSGTARSLWALAGVAAFFAAPALAQTDIVESRIAMVKVYAGSATVERVARVGSGSRSITFACLPAGLNVQSLQVSSDASVRLGETAVATVPRALAPRCQRCCLRAAGACSAAPRQGAGWCIRCALPTPRRAGQKARRTARPQHRL